MDLESESEYKRKIEILEKRIQAMLNVIYDVERKLMSVYEELHRIRFLVTPPLGGYTSKENDKKGEKK